MDTLQEHERGVGVAKIVEPHMRKPGCPKEQPPARGERVGVKRSPVPAIDHEIQVGPGCGPLAPTCLVAHVRGVTYSDEAVVADTNLHPFHFAGARVVLAHNGHLRQFPRMRYALVEHVRPELAQRIEGTTDSEWIYALVLSQLDDPYGDPETGELADATAGALRILRKVRAAHGIDTSSPVNLLISTGSAVVATRLSFDYGWYPPEDEMLETDLPFVSLWYAIGGEYTKRDGDWEMTAGDPPRSVIIASEPLTTDFSTWLEVPEYSMLTAELTPEGLEFETRDLDV